MQILDGRDNITLYNIFIFLAIYLKTISGDDVIRLAKESDAELVIDIRKEITLICNQYHNSK